MRTSHVPSDEPTAPPLLTAHEVAQILGVPVGWVYERTRRGESPTVTLGRFRRYRRNAVEDWSEAIERRSNAR